MYIIKKNWNFPPFLKDFCKYYKVYIMQMIYFEYVRRVHMNMKYSLKFLFT